jgi:queuine/archaeosine tRNA-ribosyltransferase
MLARTSMLRHKVTGATFQTPLLVPSFSSKGFGHDPDGVSEIGKILETTAEFLTDSYLISAYDLKRGHLPPIAKLPCRPDILFLDSGGYEVSRERDFSAVEEQQPENETWTVKDLLSVLDELPKEVATVLVSYDHPKERKPFQEQIRAARKLFKGRDHHLLTFLIKPEKPTQTTLDDALRAAMAHAEELGSFDIIGVTEKELGASLLERMVRIAKLRTVLDEANLKAPIHVFGALDPLGTCLYFLAGAEIFDGLTWIRYAYSEGMCVYVHNAGALKLGLYVQDRLVRTRTLANNIYFLQELQQRMREFEATKDFSKLGQHGKFLEAALDSLNTRLNKGGT